MSAQMSAIELLNLGDEGRKKPWMNYYWGQILGFTFGTAAACFINYQTRRPPFSGIQKHVFGVVSLSLLFNYIQYKRENYLAEKDAVLRHYVELHPEDFPTPERKKIGEILEPWIPIR